MTEELKGATKRKNQKAEEYQNGKQAEAVGDYGKAAAHYKKAADLKYAAAEPLIYVFCPLLWRHL